MGTKDLKIRRFCTRCRKRGYEKDMLYIYIPLVKKAFWLCLDCYNYNASSPNLLTDENYTFSEIAPAPTCQ